MRWLRRTGLLCFLAAAEFAMMTALEFLYFRRLSGGLPSLDMRFLGFTGEEALEWLNALGAHGKEIVLVWHYLTFDLVFPALLSAALASLILRAGRGMPRFACLPERTRIATAVGLVLPYMLVDYAQNIAVARLLSDPLNANPASLSLASGLVVAKFALGAVPFIVIAVFALTGHKGR